ncbi:MAG: hypothetical protein SPI25_04255 [Dialister sp.]|nr:hypothetical protein [Dialister sp.]
MWNEFPLQAQGAVSSSFKAEATTDIAKAASFSDFYVISTPATAHENILSALLPLAKEGTRFLFLNGCRAALKGLRLFQKQSIRGMTVAETATQPFWGTLSPDYRSVTVKAIKSEIAYFSSSEDPQVSAFLHEFAPHIVRLASPASVALSQTNSIIHGAASLFNITRIENGEDFLRPSHDGEGHRIHGGSRPGTAPHRFRAGSVPAVFAGYAEYVVG